MRGIRKTEIGKLPMVRLPITGPILSKLCNLLEGGIYGTYFDMLLLAALCLAFFGFLRCGEFTSQSQRFDHTSGLSYSDVTFLLEGQCVSRMLLKLKASKTDPFRQGCTIALYPTGHALCPVRTMRSYLAIRAQHVVSPHTEPLFMTAGREPLTRALFIDCLRYMLGRLGMTPSHYAGHSLR